MTPDWTSDTRPIRTIRGKARSATYTDWAHEIPAVKHLMRDGLELRPGANLLVGDNGSGKSTLIEAVAMAFGLSPEGGSRNSRHRSRASESELWRDLVLERAAGAPRWGFFLRAETMHGFYTYLEENPGGPDPAFHEMSHGESFLEILRTRFTRPGLYCLDEPEAALSFTSQLALIATLAELVDNGSQVLCATHSPIVAALPGATIWEVGPWGLRQSEYDDLGVVVQWRAFLQDPVNFLRQIT